MDRVGIRELRNYASRVVRRARDGERIVITVDGEPVAQIGPITEPTGERTLAELIRAGELRAPRSSAPPQPPAPIRSPNRRTTTEILLEQRGR